MYNMFTCFPHVVQTRRICCNAWQCIFEVAYLSCETEVIILLFGYFCVMTDAEERTGHFHVNFTGTENDLNHVLSTFVDSEDEITNFCHSRYVDLSEVQSIFQNNPNELFSLTLNIQSVNAKFNNLFPIIDNLASQGLYFGAICLKETWTSTDSDLSLLQLPGYQLIHQGSKCTKHGGMMIYLNDSYSYKIPNLFTNFNIWEGLFIDISGGNLWRTFTIGNIYWPPHDNDNNNANIQQFISELSPIIDTIQLENTYAAIVGDFNVNLLQISEREKFGDFLDLMCTNNFFPKISFPTRFARHSCSLTDQIFFKTPHKKQVSISSSIIFSNISDHLPCTVNLGISEHTTKQQKYIRTRVINDTAISNFRGELTEIVTKTYDKHFQEKRVKFNKYKHKRSNWITSGILKSIEFRDKLYKRLKICSTDNGEYDILKHNLKIYNGYLNHCIRAAKKEFYHNEFNKHKNDIRTRGLSAYKACSRFSSVIILVKIYT